MAFISTFRHSQPSSFLLLHVFSFSHLKFSLFLIYLLPSLLVSVILCLVLKHVSPEFTDELRHHLLQEFSELEPSFNHVQSTIRDFLWYSDIEKLETFVNTLRTADHLDPTYNTLRTLLAPDFLFDTIIQPCK